MAKPEVQNPVTPVQAAEVTPAEATELEKGQQRLAQNRKKALADGKISAAEKMRLEKQANRQSAKIAQKKHN